MLTVLPYSDLLRTFCGPRRRRLEVPRTNARKDDGGNGDHLLECAYAPVSPVREGSRQVTHGGRPPKASPRSGRRRRRSRRADALPAHTLHSSAGEAFFLSCRGELKRTPVRDVPYGSSAQHSARMERFAAPRRLDAKRKLASQPAVIAGLVGAGSGWGLAVPDLADTAGRRSHLPAAIRILLGREPRSSAGAIPCDRLARRRRVAKTHGVGPPHGVSGPVAGLAVQGTRTTPSGPDVGPCSEIGGVAFDR
jgi:hypothetical protein